MSDGLVKLPTVSTTEAALVHVHLLVLLEQVGFGEGLATLCDLSCGPPAWLLLGKSHCTEGTGGSWARWRPHWPLSLSAPPSAEAVQGTHLPGTGDWTQREGLAPEHSPLQQPSQGRCQNSAWPDVAGSHGCSHWNRGAPPSLGTLGSGLSCPGEAPASGRGLHG